MPCTLSLSHFLTPEAALLLQNRLSYTDAVKLVLQFLTQPLFLRPEHHLCPQVDGDNSPCLVLHAHAQEVSSRSPNIVPPDSAGQDSFAKIRKGKG